MKNVLSFFLFMQVLILSASADAIGAGPLADVVREITEIGGLLAGKKVPIENGSFKAEAIDAVIKSIDPGAAILTAAEMERLREEERGVFGGIGVKIQMVDGQPAVAGVLEGGPAASAKLAEGDLIEQIGSNIVQGMTIEQVVNLLRGRKGEAVELKMRGKDTNSEPRTVTIVRDIVKMAEAGVMEEWPHEIGYIKINGMYEDSGERAAAQLEIWATNKYSGAILDLRDTCGGDLESVMKTAQLFANAGDELFSVEDGSEEPLTEYRASAGGRVALPLMVMVNKGTGGAAEALAAVLKNRSGILLIGEASKGDDRIREGMALSGGRVLYIATKRIRPAGRPSYSGKGVEPDILVSADESAMAVETPDGSDDNDPDLFSGWSEEERENRGLLARVEADPALRRATDILLGVRALGIQVK